MKRKYYKWKNNPLFVGKITPEIDEIAYSFGYCRMDIYNRSPDLRHSA